MRRNGSGIQGFNSSLKSLPDAGVTWCAVYNTGDTPGRVREPLQNAVRKAVLSA